MKGEFMEFLADYRDAIRHRDQLDTARHQRNVFGTLAALGWLLFIVQGVVWLFRN